MSKSKENPWSVSNLDDFLKYCCPECEENYNKKETFVMHALEKHPKAKDCLELRLDSENVSIVCKNQNEKTNSYPIKLEEVLIEDVVMNVSNEDYFDLQENSKNLPESFSEDCHNKLNLQHKKDLKNDQFDLTSKDESPKKQKFSIFKG